MIIVSQDKDAIINFNNCADIHISNTVKKEYNIIATTSLGMTCKLADYKTEERAKEVLTGIMQAYVDSENYKYVNRFMTAQDLNRLQRGLAYEMPAE